MNDIMNDTKNNASVFDFKTIKISDLKKLEKEYVAFKKSQYKALKKIKSQDRNFENTILNLAEGDRSFQDKMSTIGLLLNVHTDKKFREEAVNMMTRLNKTMIDIEYDKEIYDLLIDYHENNFKTEVASGILEECDKKLVEDLVRGYKRMGFALPKVKQDKLKSLMKELGEVENNFSKT
jgi:Zn-dependent oligopeptidase